MALGLILIAQIAVANPSRIKTPERCEEEIMAHYNTEDYLLYYKRLSIIGKGRFSIHFNYKVRYLKRAKDDTITGCVANIYCADYHQEIITENEQCWDSPGELNEGL